MARLTNAQLVAIVEALRAENTSLHSAVRELQAQLDTSITSSRPRRSATVPAAPQREVFGFFVGNTHRASFFDYAKASETAKRFKAAYPDKPVTVRKFAVEQRASH